MIQYMKMKKPLRKRSINYYESTDVEFDFIYLSQFYTWLIVMFCLFVNELCE